MEWLIGIICVVIVVYFWRIFLPLGLLAAAALGLFYVYEDQKSKSAAQERERTEAAFKLKVEEARRNASPEGKEWKVFYEEDPASGKNVARYAAVPSNDSLCALLVQKRLNGGQLTGLRCPDFEIRAYEDIEVKFDNLETSDKMDLEKYTDSDGVYIPSSQSKYSGYLDYQEFINRLKSGNAVAIKLPSSDGLWMTFSLKGAANAINELGKEKAAND